MSTRTSHHTHNNTALVGGTGETRLRKPRRQFLLQTVLSSKTGRPRYYEDILLLLVHSFQLIIVCARVLGPLAYDVLTGPVADPGLRLIGGRNINKYI